MRLRISTNDTIVSAAVENAVIKTSDRGTVLFEVSCTNNDVYKFTCQELSDKKKKRLVETFENVIDALDNNRERFACSLEEFPDVKFKKSSMVSHIE